MTVVSDAPSETAGGPPPSRRDVRRAGLLIGLVVLAVVVMLSIAVGSRTIPPARFRAVR